MHEVPQTNEPKPSGDPELIKRRLDVHLAEYSALTMRITYWITIQYVIYGLAAAYLGFAVQAAGKVKLATLVWTSGLVLLLLAWALLQTQWEIFTYVKYIEKQLKPKIEPLVLDGTFWEFESFMADLRTKGFVNFEWQYGMVGFFLLAIAAVLWMVLVVFKQYSWAPADYAWAAANLYVGALVVGKAWHNQRLQKEMIASARPIVEP
jgi:hypothetical protein